MNPFTEDNLVEKTVIKLIKEIWGSSTCHINAYKDEDDLLLGREHRGEVASIKGTARELPENLKPLLVPHWRDFETNRAGVKVAISELLWLKLPEEPAYTEKECELKGFEIYNFVYENYQDARARVGVR